ncbi:unnamed protein product [Blepharisma stoltei]|uniref:Recombination activating protein 2 n=1 Tax=Blepharisma stoltei TaxID=1481888 RepID=A0AAU9KEY4_9CILI|nr:unnamed protein product [Blepharisma stoltei]
MYENQSSVSDLSLSQAYYEYVNIYHHITSLYLIDQDPGCTILTIYDTENEREDTKALKFSEKLDDGTCIAQLPNAKLFCFGGGHPITGNSYIIDRNYKVHSLASGFRSNYKF